MLSNPIKPPEQGTYQWQLFDYWSKDYRRNHAEHSAYIALNFAGVLDACRSKFLNLMDHHKQHVSDKNGNRHSRAIERLQHTLSGAAYAYERSFAQSRVTLSTCSP